MERMEAEAPFHAAVGKIDVAPVEQEELRLGTIADHRHAGVELAREPEGGRRDVEEDHAASELRQKSRQPARARAELEHSRAARELEPLQQGRDASQEKRGLVRLAEWLGEVVLPVPQRREVLLGGAIELVN